MLTIAMIAPWLGVLLVFASPRRRPGLAFATAGGTALGTAATLLALALRGDLPARVDRAWIEGLGLRWALEVDGFALAHLLATALLVPVALVLAWRDPDRRRRTVAALALAFEGLLLLAFAARDPLLFWIAQDGAAMVLFVAVVLGGGRRQLAAGTSFLLHAGLGSLPLVVALLDLRARSGGIDVPLDPATRGDIALGANEQWLGILAFTVAIATRLGLPPLQGWRRDLEVAPRGVRALLAAGWFALGSYAAIRFARPLFPDALAAGRDLLVAWALVAMILAALRRLAAAAEDERRRETEVAVIGGAAAVLVTSIALCLSLLAGRRQDPVSDLMGGLARASLVGCPGLAGFVVWFAVLRGALALGALATLGYLVASGLALAAAVARAPAPASAPRSRAPASRSIVAALGLALLLLVLGVAPDLLLGPLADLGDATGGAAR